MTKAEPDRRFALSIQMSRMAATKYRILLRKGEEEGHFVLNFPSRKGFPGRCAINTETSAVKNLRVRRQRLSE